MRLLDSKSLSYRQVNTDRDGLYRIVKTYTTDPARSSVLVQVEFRSLTKRKLDLYVLHDPALSNYGDDDSGASRTMSPRTATSSRWRARTSTARSTAR